ncbi:MAG: tRNA (adenosine(37)-N6)-dimethylallyltransferase MiaA [Planctomycetes bacterium]|nr:tRNA (adenosine(37)-N6)-dimethylallyltransferase MiaA [Planctomycetota bacterium]
MSDATHHDHHGFDPHARFPVLVVLGPTGSGKSRLAMHVAERVGGEILSVDALKVYRGMDIGTAKPTPEERTRIPHHGIDLVDANEKFSVAQFIDYAEPTLAKIVARKRVPVLDATAPYYLKALVYGVDRGPAPRPEFRDEQEQRPLAELHAQLKATDPASARRIGPTDRKRMVRALEIIEFGARLPSEVEQWGEPRADYRWMFTGIRWLRELLYARVAERGQQMFDNGWLDEVKRIRAGSGFSVTSGKAHGYRRLQQFIDGELGWDECVKETIRDVKTFARKSMTFFKSFPRVQWLDVSSENEIDRAATYLSHELKDMLAQCGVERPPVDLP